MRPLTKSRFEGLAGYARAPHTVLIFEELEYGASACERVLGMLIRDRVDGDFSGVVLGRDERLRFRAIDVFASLPTRANAREELARRVDALAEQGDEAFHQGDNVIGPVDFFAPRVVEDRTHENFRLLRDAPRYSPARELIKVMMRWHEDVDGNFIEQFQSTAFDPRLWELYLYAAFTELGYGLEKIAAAPDLMLTGVAGEIALEATTCNPQQGEMAIVWSQDPRERMDQEFSYGAIKLGRALRRKLRHQPPYWELDHVRGKPFVLAIQDFRAPGSMRYMTPLLIEHVFGVRHSREGGRAGGALQIEWLQEHRLGNMHEPAGFFRREDTRGISAIIANPLGTLSKFNRMGYVAEFGDRNVRGVREGFVRRDFDRANPAPQPFRQEMHVPGYRETWVEGMVVLHNPRAEVPLPPENIPGACHEFLQPDGRILSLLPEFHPYICSGRFWVEAD
ncbi:MAG: hypothetical protein EKK41_17295 [Hyphomicrobiales bacterium]|nr:MAG: hypothetical protein EKK41_17295 [Hyphomicrobiales bacterium]